VEKQALALPSLKTLPPGILQTTVGDAEAMAELFESFALAMLTGVLCIYVVLVLLFKDFVQPVTILAALVLSVPGAFLALFVTQTALSMPSMIGLIMLMGIATKNSILLIDYVVLARREHGLDRWHALLDACRKRARPIVMTTVAMGAGMMPIAIGLGTDPSFRAPMAIVVIGGLITSTFLSLLVIPVVFTYVDDLHPTCAGPVCPSRTPEGAAMRTATLVLLLPLIRRLQRARAARRRPSWCAPESRRWRDGEFGTGRSYSGEVRARIETTLGFRIGGKIVERRPTPGRR
jgi:predicted RND superfamily exporter protein